MSMPHDNRTGGGNKPQGCRIPTRGVFHFFKRRKGAAMEKIEN
jgi:hypothetical protein